MLLGLGLIRRALGDLFQERVRFSHDAQGDLGPAQPALGDVQLPSQPGVGLFSGGTPDLGAADFPARTPASRSLRHSVIWEEYRPSWRR